MTTAEEGAAERPTLSTTKLLAGMVRGRPVAYATDVLVGAVFFTSALAPGLLAKRFLEELVGKAEALPTLPLILAALLVSSLSYAMLGILWMYVDTALRGAVLGALRLSMFQRLLRRPPRRGVQPELGDTLGRFSEDVRLTGETLFNRGGVTSVTSSTTFTLLALGLMFHIDAQAAAWVLLPASAIVVGSYFVGRRLAHFRERSRRSASEVSAFLAEVFGALNTVKHANAGDRVAERLAALGRQRRRTTTADQVFTASMTAVSQSVAVLGTGVVLIVAASRVQDGSFGVGDLALFTYLLQEMGMGVTMVGNFIRRVSQANVSRQRLRPMLSVDADPEAVTIWPRYDRPLLEPRRSTSPAALRKRAGPLVTLEMCGVTTQDAVTGRGVVDVSLVFRPGQLTVVTGKVASGKSTLLKALAGLLPADAGSVRWNGEHLEDPSCFMVPPLCGFTPQQPTVFDGSVADNVCMGEEISREELSRCLSLAALEEEVAMMPNGVDTVLGSEGVLLSGGQTQRLGLARMFARDAEVLLLDDVTSALDTRTQDVVLGNLRSTADRGACVVLASHQREAVALADQVVVLVDGRVESAGTPTTPLRSSPALAEPPPSG
jgi:ATP-binding cassette subfamily B protein